MHSKKKKKQKPTALSSLYWARKNWRIRSMSKHHTWRGMVRELWCAEGECCVNSEERFTWSMKDLS
jgi:hypothetical protein